MKYGQKPLGYNLNYNNHEKGNLELVINFIRIFNSLLDCFAGKKATGENYGFYLLTNNLLITTLSLKRLVQFGDWNLLHILFRQSAELLFVSTLIFDDLEDNDLAKIRTTERLRQYAAYCIWSRLKHVETGLDKKNYSINNAFSDENINEFTKIRSKEFHRLTDLIGILKLNVEKSQLDIRKSKGENLFSFASVIGKGYSSLSDYMRSNFSPIHVAEYAKISSRIHGTGITLYSEDNDPNIMKSELGRPKKADMDDVAGKIYGNLQVSLQYTYDGLPILWPNLAGLPNNNIKSQR